MRHVDKELIIKSNWTNYDKIISRWWIIKSSSNMFKPTEHVFICFHMFSSVFLSSLVFLLDFLLPFLLLLLLTCHTLRLRLLSTWRQRRTAATCERSENSQRVTTGTRKSGPKKTSLLNIKKPSLEFLVCTHCFHFFSTPSTFSPSICALGGLTSGENGCGVFVWQIGCIFLLFVLLRWLLGCHQCVVGTLLLHQLRMVASEVSSRNEQNFIVLKNEW